MAFAESQDARSSNYRQSTRLTRTEVTRDSPRHIDDAERPRCDTNDYFAVGTVPPRRIFSNELSAKARRHNRGVYRQRRGAGREAPDRDVSGRGVGAPGREYITEDTKV